jgi:hypothetical protein
MLNPDGFVTFNLLAYDKETQAKAYGLIHAVEAEGKYVIEGE